MEENSNDKTGNGECEEEPTFEFYQSNDVDHYLRTGKLEKSRHTIAEGIIGMLHVAREIDKWLGNTETSRFTPGVVVAEQIPTAHAAELAMKHVLRRRGRSYCKTHDLSKLYSMFTNEEKNIVEKEYALYKKSQSSKRPAGWETAEEVFSECADASISWRFNMIESKELDAVIPSLLRAAATSVLSLEFPKDFLVLDRAAREQRKLLYDWRESVRRELTRGFQ